MASHALEGAPWAFHNPVRIVFGAGSFARLGTLCAAPRVALITTQGFTRRGVTERVRAMLGERLIAVRDDVLPNPDLEHVGQTATALQPLGVQALLAVGGGSAIDTAKALARDLAGSGSRALPVYAVPTTSGTGAEVTPFATIWDYRQRRKLSVAGEDLYPALALLDPELTHGLPSYWTVVSGLDAISHAFESIWNRHAGPISLGLAEGSLARSLKALPALVSDLEDTAARSAMMEASVMAGLAISQTRTALAHSISYPLTAQLDLPHGLACSFTLPEVLRFNLSADDGRLARLATTLGHRSGAELADALDAIFEQLGMAQLLSEKITSSEQMLRFKSEMYSPDRADNNLRAATLDDVAGIVERAAALLPTNPSANR